MLREVIPGRKMQRHLPSQRRKCAGGIGQVGGGEGVEGFGFRGCSQSRFGFDSERGGFGFGGWREGREDLRGEEEVGEGGGGEGDSEEGGDEEEVGEDAVVVKDVSINPLLLVSNRPGPRMEGTHTVAHQSGKRF